MSWFPSWFVATIPYAPCARLLFAQISVFNISFTVFQLLNTFRSQRTILPNRIKVSLHLLLAARRSNHKDRTFPQIPAMSFAHWCFYHHWMCSCTLPHPWMLKHTRSCCQLLNVLRTRRSSTSSPSLSSSSTSPCWLSKSMKAVRRSCSSFLLSVVFNFRFFEFIFQFSNFHRRWCYLGFEWKLVFHNHYTNSSVKCFVFCFVQSRTTPPPQLQKVEKYLIFFLSLSYLL